MKGKKTLSLVIVFLILMLPVHSAMVYADSGSLRGVRVHGDDDINNFIKAYDDRLHINAEASVYDNNDEPLEVDPEDLIFKLNGQGRYDFGSCSENSEGWYTCNYTSNKKDWVSDDKTTVSVELYDEDSVRLDKKTEELCVDSEEPSINSFNIPSSTTNEPMQVSYEVRDTANSECSSCGGLNSAEISSEGNTVYEEDLDDCRYDDEFEMEPGELELEEGENEVCLVVTDNFGQSSEKCKEVFVDYNPPSLESLNLTDMNGNEIEYSSSKVHKADLNLKIKEDVSRIEKEDIYANFTELYPEKAESYENRNPDECKNDEDIYVCSWEEIDIKGDGSDNAAVELNIADIAGNNVSESVSLNLPYDDTSPSVSEVTTENDGYIKPKDNVVVAKVEESGSGMAKGEIYADFRNLNPSYSAEKKADKCAEESEGWFCFWEGISVTSKDEESEVRVEITEVRDDAGNLAAHGFSGRLTYDSVPPEITEVEIKPYGEDLDVLTEDDVVEITALIDEETSGVEKENVLADFSKFDSGENWTEADSCTLEDELYQCQWEYSGKLPTGSTVGLPVVAFDNAGLESDEVTEDIFVAGIDEKEVDYWEDVIEVEADELNPNFLWMSSDGTFQRVKVELVEKTSGSYVHGFKIDECNGGPGDEDSYVSYDIERQNSPSDNKELRYLLLHVPNYEKDKLEDAEEINVECKGEIVQARSSSDDIFSPDEKVNVSITIPLLDGLFEKPGSDTVDTMEENQDVIEKINDLVEVIDTLSFLRPVCQGFNSIRSTLNSICIMLQAVPVFAAQKPSRCSQIAAKLNKWWYGSEELADEAESGGADGFQFGMQSDKGLYSLGFWCDLYLCTGCTDQWDSLVSGHDATDFLTKDWIPEDDDAEGEDENVFGLGELSASFDPQQSLPVALFCMPPCLTGIKNAALRYKQILVYYNVCENVAAVRGYGSSQCSEYKSDATCTLVVGWFWSWVEGAISDFIKNTVFNFIDKNVRDWADCSEAKGDYELSCAPNIIYEVIGWVSEVEKIRQEIKNFQDLEESFKDETDAEEDIESELEDEEFDEGVLPYE